MSGTRRFTDAEARGIGERIGIDWSGAPFDVGQFRMGLEVEMEHGPHDPATDVTGGDPVTTGKIALAHLNEFPDYYTRLARMEAEAEAMDGDDEVDTLGPVDYLVVEFPAERANFTGEVAAELRALVERGTVRVLDLILLRKDLDGSVEVMELHEADESEIGELRELEAGLALLLAAQDVEDVGAALEPGSVGAVLVYENRWAAPFGSAVRRAGGQLVANGRIPTQAILAAIEADGDGDDEEM